MDFVVRQTPSFALVPSIRYSNTPQAPVVESVKEQSKDTQTDLKIPDHHNNHVHNSENRQQVSGLDDLPFIAPEEVERANGNDNSLLWIVIDHFVYDVTEFAQRHPGGAMPLKNFAGKSCSWQFHKIHGKKTLESYGSKLRIGRTGNVPNPYDEPRHNDLHSIWKPHIF